MSLTIRSASPADEASVVAPWRECDLIAICNDPAADFRLAKAGPASDVLVAAEEDGTIIGSIMVGHGGHRGWLYYVASAPTYRTMSPPRQPTAGSGSANRWSELRKPGCGNEAC